MKRTISLLVSTILILGIIVPVSSNASTINISGDWQYTLNNGNAIISGYSGDDKENVSIPSKLYNYNVVGIGPKAFEHSEIEKITIPNSVTKLGCNCFAYCEKLNSITIPDSVIEIDTAAFSGCKSLAKITLPKNLTVIETQLFSYCKSLSSVVIGDKVKKIRTCAFNGCEALTSVTIPSSVKTLETQVFGNSGLVNAVIPDTVTSMDGYTFFGCKNLKSVTIGKGIKSLGSCTFASCSALTTVNLPDTIEELGSRCFKNCTDLTSIPTSKNLNVIKFAAFIGCTGLKSISIPNTVTYLDSDAFSDCTLLSQIILPDTLTCIGSDAFKNTAYYNNASNWANNALYIGKYLIEAKKTISGICSIKDGTILIADNAFNSCANLNEVIIPNSVLYIGDWAFWGCTGLKNVVIGKNVKSIGNKAFYDCKGLTSITIPSSVAFIGNDAFANCDNLKTSINSTNYDFNTNENPMEGCNLSGYCINASTRKGLKGATVVLYGPKTDTYNPSTEAQDRTNSYSYIANTDNEGKFEFNVKEAGFYVAQEIEAPQGFITNDNYYKQGYSVFVDDLTKENSLQTNILNVPLGKVTVKTKNLDGVGIEGIKYFLEVGSDWNVDGRYTYEVDEYNNPDINKPVFSGTSNKKGVITFEDVPLYFVDGYKWYNSCPAKITINSYETGKEVASFTAGIETEYNVCVYRETEKSEAKIISVNEAKITYMTLKNASQAVYINESIRVCAEVKNGKGDTTYKSSNSKVAKVSKTGVVTGLKAGKATITVTNNGVSKKFTVTVKKPTLNKKTVSLKAKKSFTLKITGQVGKATFTSSNKKIATVNSKGKIVVKKKGKATITVKTNGIKLTCKVTVK